MKRKIPSSGEVMGKQELLIEFDDGSISIINNNSFTLPGMQGSLCVDRVEVIRCKEEFPLEIKLFIRGFSGVSFITDSSIKKLIKS